MEDDRNTQLHQGEETQGEKAADQVEVRDRGILDSLLGRKKPEEKKPEDELVTGMENVKVSEPTEKHEEVKKEEHHEGGEKKESLLSKLHRSSSSSSSSSSDEEEVIDENGEKRKKKKGLKEKMKEKLPGHKEGEQKPHAPLASDHKEAEEHKQKPHAPLASDHKEAEEHKPYTPNDGHKAYIPASAPATTTGTTANVHHKDNAVVIQNLEETPQKGLMEKIKEKLPGGHKKTPEEVATEQDVSSPDAKEKKQGFLGKIMDKIPGYNKGAAEEEHKPVTTAAAGEHKASS